MPVALLWLLLLATRRTPSLMLRPSLHRYVIPAAAAIHLLLNVGPEFDVLVKVADVAGDFVVGLEREGDDRD